MTERHKVVPEVLLFLIKDGKILLSRRFQTGFEDGNWGLPGGHGEDRETMRQGVAREAKEEIGIEIEVEDLDFVHTQHKWSVNIKNDQEFPHARAGFYFTAKKWKGEPTNMEPEKCSGLEWFPLDALPPNMVPHVRAAIESFQRGELYDEYNWPQ